MKKVAGILFVISLLFCGISVILMTPFGIPILMHIGERYGDAFMFRFWGIAWFAPWIFAGTLFLLLDPKNAAEVLDAFDRLFPPE